MSHYVVYPRLYRSVNEADGDDINSRGDDSIVSLYRLYEDGIQDTLNLNFRFKVLDNAMRLFGDFQDWLVLQRNSPLILGWNLDFLRDTVNYLTTGHREMSPLVWLELVSERIEHADQQHHLTYPELSLPEGLTTPKALQLWCSRKGGFEDLLQTLYLFFGAQREMDR